MREASKQILYYVLPVAIVGLLAHVYLQGDIRSFINASWACRTPVTYAIGSYDERFGITEGEFRDAVSDAADVWNTAAGKELFVEATESRVQVGLVYDERQEAIALGGQIRSEEDEYRALKRDIERLRTALSATERAYLESVEDYERDGAAYTQEVARWNAQGGAPAHEYARLSREKAALERRKENLNATASRIERDVQVINENVVALNEIVSRLHTNAYTFNEVLGHDFDQANYIDDGEKREITIFTFENQDDLRRVLAHEFGHVLGIGHVENPDSLMYSYNIGNTLELTDEDKAALKEVCAL